MANLANFKEVQGSNPMYFNYRMIKRGSAGDATLLRPTVMAAVPLMLDRIYKAIHEKVRKGSPLSQKMFHWAYEYK